MGPRPQSVQWLVVSRYVIYNSLTLANVCALIPEGMVGTVLVSAALFPLAVSAGIGLAAVWLLLVGGSRLRSMPAGLVRSAGEGLGSPPTGRQVPGTGRALGIAREASTSTKTSLATSARMRTWELGPSGRKRQVWVCAGCGERIEREEHSELRMPDGYWHRSCWVAEAERRAPGWSELKRRSEDRMAVAELLLRAEDRERSGFDVLGRRGLLGQVGADNHRSTVHRCF